MRLDYQIKHWLHPHVDGGRCIYDHIKFTVWFSKESLMREINEKFGTDFILEKENEINKEQYFSIWHYVDGRKDLTGAFGVKYDCDIRGVWD